MLRSPYPPNSSVVVVGGSHESSQHSRAVADDERCDIGGASVVAWRAAGRGQNEIRRLFFRTGFLQRASGSAHASLGNTKVQCAVHGPVQGDGMELKLELKVADFARPRHLQSTTALADQHLLAQVAEAVEAVLRKTSATKYGLQINIVIVEDDGGLLPCTLNCVGLALANAGVEMVGIMAAVNVYAVNFDEARRYWKTLEKENVCVLGDGEVVCLLDMDSDETKFFECEGNLTQLTLAMCPSLEAVCVLQGRGMHLSDASGETLLALAAAGCHAVGNEISKCLEEGLLGREEEAELANERRVAIQERFFCGAGEQIFI